MEPLYYEHSGTLILVLITEVSSIQRSLNTLQYYTGTQNGVLITEVSAIRRFVIERFHCIVISIGKLWLCMRRKLYRTSECAEFNLYHVYLGCI